MTIMIIAIDTGGTKTLVASSDQNGQIINKIKFPTPKDYDEFIGVLSSTVKDVSLEEQPSLIVMAVPGMLDRESGVVKQLGNLPWINKPVGPDVSKATGINKIIIENDANLAGLSEAHSLSDVNQKVMYITFSTGIGTAFVVNGILEPSLLDSEGGHMVFEDDGQLKDWESISAGRIIVEKYGKLASEIDDPSIWHEIVKKMAIGIVNNNAVFMGDIVVVGGGVGTYFEKYGNMLNQEVEAVTKLSKMVRLPKVVGAQNAEEAVILGCIILARQHE